MKTLKILFFLFLTYGYTHQLQAEAFCALRDPQQGIFTLYPQATSYRSIVRSINSTTRYQVKQQLPQNSLHFSELGRHTLYVALDGKIPLGLIHVRSEESRWGLVEVAWAMDMDLRIVDFYWQRCRNSQKHVLEKEAFKKQLRGKSFYDLKNLFDDTSKQLRTDALDIPKGAEALALVLLRCGLKTTLVTQLIWKKDIERLQYAN